MKKLICLLLILIFIASSVGTAFACSVDEKCYGHSKTHISGHHNNTIPDTPDSWFKDHNRSNNHIDQDAEKARNGHTTNGNKNSGNERPDFSAVGPLAWLKSIFSW